MLKALFLSWDFHIFASIFCLVETVIFKIYDVADCNQLQK